MRHAPVHGRRSHQTLPTGSIFHGLLLSYRKPSMNLSVRTSIVRRRLAFVILVPLQFAALAACTDSSTPLATPEKSGPPSLEDARNATYVGILDDPVTLRDGSWQGPPFAEDGSSRPAVELVPGLHLQADVSGDGHEDLVVLVGESSGGSAQNLYIAVLSRTENGVTNSGTAFLGDRVRVVDMVLQNGRISMSLVEHGAADAMCCPTQKATREWTLTGSSLEQVHRVVEGTMSLSDLLGSEWRLVTMGLDREVPERPPVTLRFDTDRVGGSAGCNNYFTSFSETSPGVLSVGPVGATRRMCEPPVMDIEDAYLKRLDKVLGYDFVTGALALTYELGGERDRMTFRRVR
jgi:heat shock protein HslJ